MTENKAVKTMAMFLAGMLLLVSIGATTALADPDYGMAEWLPGGGSQDTAFDNNTAGADDNLAELEGYLTLNTMSPFPVNWTMYYPSYGDVYREPNVPWNGGSIDVDAEHFGYWKDDSVNITEDFVDLDMAIRFNITVVDYDGWDDVQSVRIHFWYSEDPANPGNFFVTYSQYDDWFDNAGERYGNYRFILEYDQTLGGGFNDTDNWVLHDATNNTLTGGEVTLRPDLCTASNVTSLYDNAFFNTTMYEYDISRDNAMPAVNLSFYFVLGRQIVHAPATGGFTPPDLSYKGVNGAFAEAFFNDDETWRISVTFEDAQTAPAMEYPLGEFGTYRYTSLYLNDTTPYASGDPGETVLTTPFLINYSANAAHTMDVRLDGNLTRNDWAKYLQWIPTTAVSIDATRTLEESYGGPGIRDPLPGVNEFPATHYGNNTGDSDRQNGETGIDANSYKGTYPAHHEVDEPNPEVVLMTYDKGPERWGNQSVGTVFVIAIPANTLGGSYHTVIRFRVSHT